MVARRTRSSLILIALVLVCAASWSTPAPAKAYSTGTVTSVSFSYSTAYGGSLLVNYCMANANYHRLESTQEWPTYQDLGAWNFGYLNGCASRYVAIGLDPSEIDYIEVIAADIDPNYSLCTDKEHRRAFRVWRNGTTSQLAWQEQRVQCA